MKPKAKAGNPVKTRINCRQVACAVVLSVMTVMAAQSALAASADSSHSAMAPIKAYLMASEQQEIALARSAAPPSLSNHATVMVLGVHGFVTAVNGSNGFVCLVARSWGFAASLKSARFWNPKYVIPLCFNAKGAQTVVADYLQLTQWALAGATRAEIDAREKAGWAAGQMKEPAAGAMCYMMSKDGWGVGGHPGPWRPHLMFYFPARQTPNWGANLAGTPVAGSPSSGNAKISVLVVVVPFWSDGSPGPKF